MQAQTVSFKHQIPSIGSMVLICLALILFGAETPGFSVIVSALILVWTLICRFLYQSFKLDILGWLMLAGWAALVILSYFKGYFIGHEDHYFMALTAICIFWLGQSASASSSSIEFAWRSFLFIGFLFSAFALFQHILFPDQIYGFEKKYHLSRLTGTFTSSNTAATFLGLVVLASLGHIFRIWLKANAKMDSYGFHKFSYILQKAYISIGTFLFALTALLLTASRSGIAITFLSAGLFSMWVFKRTYFGKFKVRRFKLGEVFILILVILFGSAAIWKLSGSLAMERYKTILADTTQRTDLVIASWQAFKHKPFLGHGLGRFNEAKLWSSNAETNHTVMMHEAAHNIILQTLLQSGIIGFVTLSSLYLFVFFGLIKAIRNRQSYSTYMTAIVMMSFLVCTHGLFDYGLEVPAVMLTHMWILGLGYGLHSGRARH